MILIIFIKTLAVEPLLCETPVKQNIVDKTTVLTAIPSNAKRIESLTSVIRRALTVTLKANEILLPLLSV